MTTPTVNIKNNSKDRQNVSSKQTARGIKELAPTESENNKPIRIKQKQDIDYPRKQNSLAHERIVRTDECKIL